MDGFNGAFGDRTGFLPQLHAAYRNVDRRYRRELVDLPGGPSRYEVEVARTVNTVELVVYSWMSVVNTCYCCCCCIYTSILKEKEHSILSLLSLATAYPPAARLFSIHF